jgi:hypothetical protein
MKIASKKHLSLPRALNWGQVKKSPTSFSILTIFFNNSSTPFEFWVVARFSVRCPVKTAPSTMALHSRMKIGVGRKSLTYARAEISINGPGYESGGGTNQRQKKNGRDGIGLPLVKSQPDEPANRHLEVCEAGRRF